MLDSNIEILISLHMHTKIPLGIALYFLRFLFILYKLMNAAVGEYVQPYWCNVLSVTPVKQ